MPITIKFNPDQLEANIRQAGEAAVKHVANRMKLTAIKIVALAQQYAPLKTGALEDAIKWGQGKDGRRNAFVVYIDLDHLRGDNRPGSVGDYAFVMEEQLHPYGRQAGSRYYTLGPTSQAKGGKVGGRFLARAIKEGTRDILPLMRGDVQRVFGGGRTIPMTTSRPDSGDDE